MEPVLTSATAPSLGLTVLILAGAIISGLLLGRKLPTVERLVLVWLAYDALTHFIMEGLFVYYSMTTTVLKSDAVLAELWKEYARADARWGIFDANLVAMEILTVVVVGFLIVVLMYAIVQDKHYRHYVQIVVCVCELYGGWMTFVPEWLTGSPNLDTSNFLFLWVYLVFFNGLWVIIPLALLYQSWVALRDQHAKLTTVTTRAKAKGKKK